MITIIDPLSKYPDTDNKLIVESAGMIPLWIDITPETTNLKDTLAKLYGFGNLFEMKGSIISKDGVLSYPNDPDLHPIIKFDRQFETVYQYPYGYVAIVYKDDQPTFVTRMD